MDMFSKTMLSPYMPKHNKVKESLTTFRCNGHIELAPIFIDQLHSMGHVVNITPTAFPCQEPFLVSN